MRLESDVKTVLEASRVDGNKLTLPGQLPRPLYVRVAKALELMGGHWDRKAAGHVFEDDATEVVADAISTGAVVDAKKEFQFFETSPLVAAMLIQAAGIAELPESALILEPSAGSGRLLDAVTEAGHCAAYCELEEDRATRLQQRYFSTDHRFLTRNFLELGPKHPEWPTNATGNGGFDRIVANPPFSRGQDVIHVGHMFDLLAPGGRLVSVMSPGWTFKKDLRSTAFRGLVKSSGGIWKDLPPGSFKASGTNVATGFIVLAKGKARR